MFQREVFSYHEINNQSRLPLLLRLFSVSILAHVAGFAFMMYAIPAMQDVAFLAQFIGGTRGHNTVDKDYKPDDSEVHFGGDPGDMYVSKFEYPAGYFMTDEEKAAALVAQANPTTPQVVSSVNGGGFGGVNGAPKTLPSLNNIKPTTPASLPDDYGIDSPFSIGGSTSGIKPGSVPKSKTPTLTIKKPVTNKNPSTLNVPGFSGSPKTLPNLDEVNNPNGKKEAAKNPTDKKPVKSNTDTTVAETDPNEINRKPLKDLAGVFSQLKAEKKVDLEQSFMMKMKGNFDKNYRLTPTENVALSPNNEGTQTLATEFLKAINASHVLSYLSGLRKNLPANKNLGLSLMINQDVEKKEVSLAITVETESPEKANILKTGLTGGKDVTMMLRKGKDEEIFLSNTTISSEGNMINISCVMPRELALPILQRYIGTDENKTDNKQNALITEKNANTGK